MSSPGVARFFLSAAVARLGVAMSGLAVMWAVYGVSGSFGLAGTAAGMFAAAEAIAGPQIARLVDRHGQRRVVPFTAGVFAVAASLLVVACARSAAAGILLPLAALVGTTVPPIGALSAARWRRVAGPDERVLTAGMSLDGAANDTAFLVGPVLVTGLSAVFLPWAGLGLAVALVVSGLAVLLTATGTEPEAGPATAPGITSEVGTAGVAGTGPAGLAGLIMDRRLIERRFLGLFAANLALGLFFGGIGVAIAGFAVAHGSGALTGAITGVAGAVSLVAGLVYGNLAKGNRPENGPTESGPAEGKPTRSDLVEGGPRESGLAEGRLTNGDLTNGDLARSGPGTVMAVASLVLTVGCALLALTPSVPVMFAGYAVVGGVVALVVIPGAVLVQQVTAREVATQAWTWINSASALGIATAAPLIGIVVQRNGWSSGFLVLSGLTAALPLSLLFLHNVRKGTNRGARKEADHDSRKGAAGVRR
ncbi:MFS transporter [Actinoplanes couchii]|uniref:Major facilitator superfamily MFS_1 n=1 Tax=Actinoplanes couchii TaxID=403638 RepID=A0ABQ3XPH7_9ACTN|nr:MFS transporter [Actinoplanes couchii]MDR6319073.1 MFS family permease [Actinoplanes couchii]GID60416.1 hypothetical protein Aco03nite_088200 [Actinoplanes couchii]